MIIWFIYIYIKKVECKRDSEEACRKVICWSNLTLGPENFQFFFFFFLTQKIIVYKRKYTVTKNTKSLFAGK